MTNTNSGTRVEFIDTLFKSKGRAEVATITDKEVITEECTPHFRSSTDEQLATMGKWAVIKGTLDAYKYLVKGSAFNPKVALAELAVGAVIAAAVAPPYYEWLKRDQKNNNHR